MRKVFLAFSMFFLVFAFAAVAAEPTVARRAASERAGVARVNNQSENSENKTSSRVGMSARGVAVAGSASSTSATSTTSTYATTACQKSYMDCMDKFCLSTDDEKLRCGCSKKIVSANKTLSEIETIQSNAERMLVEDFERAKLGSQADLVFGTTNAAKVVQKKSIDTSEITVSSSDMAQYFKRASSTTNTIEDLIGDDLYQSALSACATQLQKCGNDAVMAKMLYEKQIGDNCTSYVGFLDGQKKLASSNLLSAQKSVRSARYDNIGAENDPNKYNRGECVLAMRECVAIKGGCGENFENCLDKNLLNRRQSACENILNQCSAVRDLVISDFEAEKKTILANAEVLTDSNKRKTCFARIESCLEEGCSPKTNSACLNDVKVAKAICPVIGECEELVPGISNSIESKLAFLRVRFCQQELTSCYVEKCGANYNNAECVGKSTTDLEKLCPKNTYASCNGIGGTEFAAIRGSIFLGMDYQLVQGCTNYFAEKLGASCGADMSCLDENVGINKLTKSTDVQNWMKESNIAVDKFFAQFESNKTIESCRGSVGETVFNSAKSVAKLNASQRVGRKYAAKLVSLAKSESSDAARITCGALKNSDSSIKTVQFDSSTNKCHVCRTERVCDTGGQSKGTSFGLGAAGGAAAGAGIGTSLSPGWGTLIGTAIGSVGGGVMGMLASGEKTSCQEITSCEDI